MDANAMASGQSSPRSRSPRRSNYDAAAAAGDGVGVEPMDAGQETPLAQHKPVFRIALTGGPCGGKTTSASVLSDRLQDLGWRVFRIPEAATILLSGGISFYELSDEQQFIFQKSLLQLMLSLEQSFLDIANASEQRAAVIYDRGAMDCSAYMKPEAWKRLLAELNLTDVELRDSRYDCVVHLVSAADGAEQFYSNLTNATRAEDAEFARSLDARVKEAWVGHPYLNVIDNSTSFETKVSRVVDTVFKHIGEQAPGLVKRKFLVRHVLDPFPGKFEDYDVVHDYLVTQDGSQARLRKRGQYGVYTYSHTVRYPDAHGQRLELRRVINGRDYTSLLSQRDPDRVSISKRRRTFVHKNQYYQLDYYKDAAFQGLILLETYMNASGPVEMPEFLDIAKEVTNDKRYSMYNLALKGAYRSSSAVNSNYEEDLHFISMRRGLDMK